MASVLWAAIGVCLASGLLHLLLAGRRGRARAHALFAVLCFVLVALLYFDTRAYYAASAAEHLAALRSVLSTLLLFWAAYAWFCHAYTGFGSRLALLTLSGWYAALLVANLLMPGTLLFWSPQPPRTLVTPWGEPLSVVQSVADIAWTGMAYYIGTLVIATWVLGAALRQARSGRRPEGLALGLGATLVLVGLVCDGLVDALSLDWVYTSELGFVAMAVVMNTRLALDWVQAGRRIRLAEEALRRNESDLRRAQSVARIGSWRYTRAPRTFEASAELARILGHPPGVPVTRESFISSVHPDDRDRVVAATRAIFEGHPLDLRGRLVVDGRERWAHGLGQAERDASGQVQAIVGTVQDITDQVALESRLFQAQKMEAVGQLAGGVAHDFNNLLQVIGGNAELALLELPADHPAHDFMATVASAGERATTLVQQLLAFSRRQVLRLQSLDVNEVTGAFMKTLARSLGEHIRISFVPGHGLWAVTADRGQLEVVVMNLCVNARDAMPDGGLLTLATGNVEIGEEYRVDHPWARPGPYVRLAVGDSGCGMDRATLRHVFEPFFTTKAMGRGTGLGLATVYGIVKQHGGMIDVSSQVGQGTSVEIYLPRAAAEEKATTAPIRPQAPGGSETILVVEDEEEVRAFARQVLERAGYTVLTASDGVEAFQVVEEHGERLDLLLLDVILPGASGREIHETLRQRLAGLRFLFISGFSPDTVHDGFVMRHGLDFLQKPVSAEKLLRAVRRVLDAPGGGESSGPPYP